MKFVLVAVMFVATAASATDLPMDTVVLGALDKVSGRVNTIKGAVGEQLTFGNLNIVARTCLTHPPEERPENAAFLEIAQTLQDKKEPPKQVFSGWMFSSNPAVSAMDHPVYDVWVLACEPSNKKASNSR